MSATSRSGVRRMVSATFTLGLTAGLALPLAPAHAADTTGPVVTVAPISPTQYCTGSSAQPVHVKATVTEDSQDLAGVTAKLFNPTNGSTSRPASCAPPAARPTAPGRATSCSRYAPTGSARQARLLDPRHPAQRAVVAQWEDHQGRHLHPIHRGGCRSGQASPGARHRPQGGDASRHAHLRQHRSGARPRTEGA